MSRKEVMWFFGFVFLWLFPYFTTIILNGMDMAFLNRMPDAEDLLPAALCVQIPKDYETAAIEAQAVIARTNLWRKIDEQKYIPEILADIASGLRESNAGWDFYDPVYEKAVRETEGKILTFEGELKLVPYHEISSGRTRDGESAFHDSRYAYLKSVDSGGDKNAPAYLNSTYIPLQQMASELEILEREDTGYVISLTANGSLLEGESFARGMGLSSSDFTIQEIGGEIRFLCKGRGHGLGFSQYGGNVMAEEGSSWEEILSFYFPAMEQCDVDDLKKTE